MKVPVLLPKIFNYPLTYLNESNFSLKAGDIVEVPFGKNKEVGVVWDKIQPTNKNIKYKKIDKKIEGFSINKNLIKFIEWFSSYNIVSKGMVLKMCLGNKNNALKKEEVNTHKQVELSNKYLLNTEQKKALKDIVKTGNSFDVSVLQGVTGSGKTLVYFERIKKILDKKKQVLVLLPEIFLTNQFKERFFDFFGFGGVYVPLSSVS